MHRVSRVDDDTTTEPVVEGLRHYFRRIVPDWAVEWWPDAGMVSAQEKIEDGTCFVLDHRWKGTSVDSMIDRIYGLNPDSRVIVCTGKQIEPSDLVRLGRLGVFSYWTKPIDIQTVSRVLVDVCQSPTATLTSLRQDGMAKLLVEKAAQYERDLNYANSQNELLARERDALSAGTALEVRRELMYLLKIALPIVLVSLSVVLVKLFTGEAAWVVLTSVAIGTIASLLLGEVVEKLRFKSGDAQVSITGRRAPGPNGRRAGSFPGSTRGTAFQSGPGPSWIEADH